MNARNSAAGRPTGNLLFRGDVMNRMESGGMGQAYLLGDRDTLGVLPEAKRFELYGVAWQWLDENGLTDCTSVAADLTLERQESVYFVIPLNPLWRVHFIPQSMDGWGLVKDDKQIAGGSPEGNDLQELRGAVIKPALERWNRERTAAIHQYRMQAIDPQASPSVKDQRFQVVERSFKELVGQLRKTRSMGVGVA